MSGPNTNFDPVAVAALDPAAIEEAVAAALAAAADATDLAALKVARTAHQGDKSPLALANREIGALPPSAKAEAGKRVGQARGRVSQAYAVRQRELEAERDARILIDEAVDVTLPTGRRPLGRRHPTELMSERIADVFVGLGWELAEGPEVAAEWFNFDALNFDADHPARQMQDTFYVDPPDGG
ncbi:MAG TPA: phenylalanine--tRNA ligase subunit alpha, partial [Phycicoccus sp.]|nr:phenylalanine--tRNA ligase subunit alpha [Phycicoccus sp.]